MAVDPGFEFLSAYKVKWDLVANGVPLHMGFAPEKALMPYIVLEAPTQVQDDTTTGLFEHLSLRSWAYAKTASLVSELRQKVTDTFDRVAGHSMMLDTWLVVASRRIRAIGPRRFGEEEWEYEIYFEFTVQKST